MTQRTVLAKAPERIVREMFIYIDRIFGTTNHKYIFLWISKPQMKHQNSENMGPFRLSHTVSNDEENQLLFKKYLGLRSQSHQDKLQWLSSWPMTLTTTHHWTYSTNRVRWTASDEKHGNIAGGTIHEDSAVHFSDRVTTLCKACGSRVPPSAQGTIKPTAHSTHGPPCPKDRGKVVGTARSFW